MSAWQCKCVCACCVSHLLQGSTAPVCVSGDVSAISAFAQMHRQRVSGMGILAPDGCLVGCVSVSQLRGITPERFGALALPVAEFVALAGRGAQAWEDVIFGKHMDGVEAHDWRTVLAGAPPVTCRPSTPLVEVMQRLADSRRHRCWVTEDGGCSKALGVITLTDILRRVTQ